MVLAILLRGARGVRVGGVGAGPSESSAVLVLLEDSGSGINRNVGFHLICATLFVREGKNVVTVLEHKFHCYCVESESNVDSSDI